MRDYQKPTKGQLIYQIDTIQCKDAFTKGVSNKLINFMSKKRKYLNQVMQLIKKVEKSGGVKI